MIPLKEKRVEGLIAITLIEARIDVSPASFRQGWRSCKAQLSNDMTRSILIVVVLSRAVPMDRAHGRKPMTLRTAQPPHQLPSLPLDPERMPLPFVANESNEDSSDRAKTVRAKAMVVDYFQRKGWGVVTELRLPDGAIADVVAADIRSQAITIVEIKVSTNDLRRDVVARKWKSYANHAHRFAFALPGALVDQALEMLPQYVGVLGLSNLQVHVRRDAKRRSPSQRIYPTILGLMFMHAVRLTANGFSANYDADPDSGLVHLMDKGASTTHRPK